MFSTRFNKYEEPKVKKHTDYTGATDKDDRHTSWLGGLASSQSMDITNDPRFFSDNVINYRLTAFAGLSVVSGLLVQNAMDQIFDMNKVIDLILIDNKPWQSVDAICLIVSFVILVYILFVQMFSIYVGVCQPYHTYRLMTSGPHGFEAAAQYYLNPMMVRMRHGSIKTMFTSLPLYLLQMAIRILVKFNDDTMAAPDPPAEAPLHSQFLGVAFCTLFCVAGFILIYIHVQHTSIFGASYSILHKPSLQGHMSAMMRSMNQRPDV